MSSVDVEIITHAYRYARSLSYQMSGLILDPPNLEVQLTVYFTDSDDSVKRAMATLYPHFPVNVHLVPRHLDKPRLFRRAIGRNDACLQTLAGACVLATDADYVWDSAALEGIVKHGIMEDAALTFPRHYHKQIDHATGDLYLERQIEPKVLGLDPKDFEDCKISKAIGGIQVIRADIARKYGYLNGTRWMTPHKGERMGCCRCDRGYRGWIEAKGYAIKGFDGSMPWRIRHSKKGRTDDVDN